MRDEELYDLRVKYDRELKEIKEQIIHFTDKEKINLCERCLHTRGRNEGFDPRQFDTFFCDGCGDIKEVLNVKIAELVKEKGIAAEHYHLIKGPKVFFNNRFKSWL